MIHSDRLCQVAQRKLVKQIVAGLGNVDNRPSAGVQFQCCTLCTHCVLFSGERKSTLAKGTKQKEVMAQELNYLLWLTRSNKNVIMLRNI